MNPLAIFTGPWGLFAKWAVIAALGAALFGGGYVKGYLHEEHTLATFTAQVQAQGDVAAKKAADQTKADQAAKEKADAENAKSLAGLRADNQRLLNARTSGSYLPAAPAGSSEPDRACLDRSLAESALRRLDEGTTGLLGEGDEAITNLNTDKVWAQKPAGSK